MKKLLLLLIVICITSVTTFGQAIPRQIDYQGVLKTSSGTIVPNGNYQLTFKIYNDPTGGSPLWTETQVIAVANGIFAAHLGSITPITTVPFDRIHFLGITVAADPELLPRTMLTPAPYSFMAMNVMDNTVVKTLNSLKDDINLVAGSNITITPSGNSITISATGGGGGTIGGSGTTNYIPVFTNSTTIGNSMISQSSVGVNVTSTVSSNINPTLILSRTGGNSATSAAFINSSGNSFAVGMRSDGKFGISSLNNNVGLDDALIINSANKNIGIGTTSPSYPLDVQSSDASSVIRAHFTGTTQTDAHGVYGYSRPTPGYGIGGSFEGGWRGVAGYSDGTSYSSLTYGVYGASSGGTTGTRIGVYGNASGGSTSWAGYFSGNAIVTGTLSKGGGSFKIDHPLDPANKYLYHSFVESPDMMNIYNGNIITDGAGYATVTLPDWFEALNKDFRYQLTVIGDFAQAIISQEVQNNQFSIRTDLPNIKVSWQVTGIRKDAFAEKNRIPVEVLKTGDEVGKYLHPTAFGLSESMGIDYEKNNPDRESLSK